MKEYILQPSGSPQSRYLDYLLKRLTDFRRAGDSYGQKHSGEVTDHITRKIIQSQLAWNLDDETHFGETCDHIKAKIDETILGQTNIANHRPNYHSFEDHGKPKPKTKAKIAIVPQAVATRPIEVPRIASKPSPTVSRQIPPTVGICATVAETLQTTSNEPNASEIAWLWHTAFETVEAQTKAGKSEKKTKRAVLTFLAKHAKFLSDTEAALRRMFNRKFEHWKMNGRVAACLVDGRIEANGKRRVQLSDEDLKTVADLALVKHGGEAAPAWRACLERGNLSPEIVSRYLLNPFVAHPQSDRAGGPAGNRIAQR